MHNFTEEINKIYNNFVEKVFPLLKKRDVLLREYRKKLEEKKIEEIRTKILNNHSHK